LTSYSKFSIICENIPENKMNGLRFARRTVSSFVKMAGCLLFEFVLLVCPVLSEEIYHWTDENGTVHFTDSLQKIPPGSRTQVEKKSVEKDLPGVKAGEEKSGFDPPVPNPSTERPEIPLSRTELKRHQVSFKPYEGDARRIIVEVTLNGSVKAPMLIDTGARGLIVTPKLAEKLGLFGKNRERLIIITGGIGGEVPAIRTIVDRMGIGGAQGNFIPTTVTELNSEAFEGLVGMDFLSNYSMTVDWKSKAIIFEELPLDPKLPGGRDEQWWRALYKEFGSMQMGWRKYQEFISHQLENSLIATGGGIEDMREMKEFSSFQSREADKLLNRLDRYANQHSVPRHWRQH
jgi:hypothetical protein